MQKLCFSLAFVLTGLFAHAQVPDWIWRSNTPQENETVYFRKTFNCGFKPEKAELTCTGDDNLTVFLNGKQVAATPDWRQPVSVDLRGQLQMGDNVFAVQTKNFGSKAGVVLKLEMRTANGSPRFVLSDKSWVCTTTPESGWQQLNFAATGWSPVTTLGQLGVEPWGEALGKPSATPAESLTLLPGFKAELLKSADRSEGSWICMTIDDKGRFIVSPEKNEFPLLRITVSKKGVVKTEKFAEPMRAAMGLCYAFDSLYLNGRGPKGVGLYKLTDKNHNDQYEPNEITLLKNFDGDNEHGYHAVVLGPDNHIYVMNGNHTKVPDGVAADSPYGNYQEDLILPRQWDPNGHAKGILAPGGYVLRTDRDGRKWQMICAGFRNTYDFDFDPDGEMFTFDSDMEWDVGVPWYRPTRVNHLVSGGEYGWRSGSGKWPVYYHDSLPTTVDIGLSSPTGVKFGTQSKFPPYYKDAFFISDWAYGKIFAVHLKPQGSTYGGTFETFVSGKPLNVVDIEFGRDGAMYFILGGWKTQSGLYRVSYVGGEKKQTIVQSSRAERRLAAAQRDIRHNLEAFHGRKSPQAIEVAWPYLDNADRWLRFAARVAIESQDVSLWQQRALAEDRAEPALTALLALTRCGSKTLQPGIVQRLGHFLAQPLSEAQMLELLRTYEVCFTRMGQPDASTAKTAISALSSVYPAKTEFVNRELCQLLVYLGAPDVLPKTMSLLAAAPTQEEQMHYAWVLRNVTNGWTLDQRKAYFQWFNKALAEYKGGNSFDKYLVNARNEAAEKLSPADRTELASIIEGKPQVKPVVLPKREFVREWKLGDFVSDLEKIGKGRSFAKGKEAFAAAQCILCHRAGTEGGSVGPDLTGVSGRFNRHDLLDNILSPSKIISDRYQSFTIVKKNEEEFSGYIVEENAEKVVIMFDPLNAKTMEIKKSDIQSRTISKLSAMPEGLINVLMKEEILDLVAFIESDGKPSGAAFVVKK